MIIPHPESNLKLNPMVLGADIISILKNKHKGNFVIVENALEDFLKKDEKRTPDLFMYSLIFLYSLGIVEKKGYKIKIVAQTINQKQIPLF